MKINLDLDFAKQCEHYSRLLIGLIAVGLCFLFIVVLYQAQQLKSELAIDSDSIDKRLKPSSKKISPSLKQTFKLARQTQSALNVPWEEMFLSLENAQKDVPRMRLLSVQPDPKKAEIMIIGVVDDFDVLAKYIDVIKNQPSIADAVLQRQQWEEAPIEEVRLNFILALRWKL